MTSPDPVVERVARAIHAKSVDRNEPWNARVVGGVAYYLMLARAAVAAMGDTIPEPDSDENVSTDLVVKARKLAEHPQPVGEWHVSDAVFIADARWWLPQLADAIEMAEAEIEGLRAQLARSVPVPVAPQTEHGDEITEDGHGCGLTGGTR